MQIFIDSADFTEIKAAAETGLVDGVTTNPSLVAKSGERFEDLLQRICEVVDGPISAEVTAPDWRGMVAEGKKYLQIHNNITVKTPLTTDGLRATRALTSDGHKVNVTLCFSAVQAVMAAKVNATFVSPFVGRLDDIGEDGMGLIRDIKKAYDSYGYKTKILVASVRNVAHVLESIKIGADVATIPPKVFNQLLKHPLTDKGLAQFMKDWEKAKK